LSHLPLGDISATIEENLLNLLKIQPDTTGSTQPELDGQKTLPERSAPG